MALDDNERRILYRNLINDPATQSETRKYSFTDWEKKLLSDEKAIGKLAQFSVGRNWAIDENDFAERFVPELKAPPTPKPAPAPAQQFPVGIAAPESIKGAVPSVTDIGREMAFKPAVQQPIEPVEPVEPIGVMAPEPIVEPSPSVTEVAREMAFKPPVQPKMPKEEEMSPLETAGQKVMEFASGFNRALFKAPSSVVKTASELGVGVINMLGGDMQSEDAVLYSLADKYDKWLDTSEVAKKWIGKPEYTGLATDVGSGLGQIASMVAAGPQGASQALLKTPTVLKAVSQQMFSKPSLIAFSQVFNSEFENMKAKGESEQTAFNQGLTNALATSPLENLPLINLAERLNKTIGVKLARRVLNALQQGAEEGGQEAVQQVFSNLTNNQLVESEQNIVDWAQGIQPSAEAGGVVGLLIGGLANAKAARGYSKTSGLDKFSDNVVNNEIIQNAARDYRDNIAKAEQQGKKPDSFNQKQLKKISENPEAWVRDEIKYIQQTIESNKTLGLDSKVEENSLAKATSLLNQIKAEKKRMEQADITPAQEAVPVAPEAEVIAPGPIAPEVATEENLAEDIPFEEVPSETEDELAFLDEMRLAPEEEAAPVAPVEEDTPEVAPEIAAPQTREEIIKSNEKARQEYKKQRVEKREERLARKQQLIDSGLSDGEATAVLTKEIRDEEDAFESSLPKVPELTKSQFEVNTEKNEADFKKMLQQTGAKETNKAWGITNLGDEFGYEIGDKNGAIYIKPYEEEIDTEEGRENVVTGTAIELVYVPPTQRGKGKAKKLIQQVVDAADKTGTTLKIEAVPQGEEVDAAGLKKLYESFGFVFDDIYGTRAPQAAPVAQAEEVTPEVVAAAPAPKGRGKAAPVTPTPAAPKKEQAPKPAETKEGKKAEAKGEKVTPKLKDYKIKPPSDDVSEVAQSSGLTAGKKNTTKPISELSGGVDLKQEKERRRVDKLKEEITSEGGYISRLIVNKDGEVIEGQHRLEALRELGFTEVPVVELLGPDDYISDVIGLRKAIEDAGLKSVTSQNELVDNITEILVDEKGDVSQLEFYEAPKGYEKPWFAAVKFLTQQQQPSAPSFTSSQSSEAATAFDKAKTSKGFDKKHGKGAYKALSDITKNFEDIMDGMSGKIKQDCL